eukprot:13815432-Ditylum_brightwellii.AAC.1
MSLAIRHLKISPMPTGYMPRYLSSAIRQLAMRVQYTTHDRDTFPSHCAHVANSTLSTSDACWLSAPPICPHKQY